MSVLGYIFLVALLCGFFSLFRFSVSIGLLERPLVVGLIWALFTGDWLLSMYIAVFFELAWLDLIPVGTFIPPHLTAATLSALALVHWFDMYHVSDILLVILVSIPLAWLGTKLEGRLRSYNSRTYDSAMLWLEEDPLPRFPERTVWKTIGIGFVATTLFFFVSMLVLGALLKMVLPMVGPLLIKLEVTWPHLWLGASLGGLLALRLRRAYAVFASGLGLVTILAIAAIL